MYSGTRNPNVVVVTGVGTVARLVTTTLYGDAIRRRKTVGVVDKCGMVKLWPL